MGVFYDKCVDFSILGALFYIYPLTQNLCLFALSVDATVLINNAYKKTMCTSWLLSSRKALPYTRESAK